MAITGVDSASVPWMRADSPWVGGAVKANRRSAGAGLSGESYRRNVDRLIAAGAWILHPTTEGPHFATLAFPRSSCSSRDRFTTLD